MEDKGEKEVDKEKKEKKGKLVNRHLSTFKNFLTKK